jgi:hypothetical protein
MLRLVEQWQAELGDIDQNRVELAKIGPTRPGRVLPTMMLSLCVNVGIPVILVTKSDQRQMGLLCAPGKRGFFPDPRFLRVTVRSRFMHDRESR